MTRYLLVLATALLPFSTLAQTKSKPAPAKAKSASTAAPAPAATPGSTAQLESQFSAEICQDFDKQNAAKPFAQLSQQDALNVFQQSMTQVVMKHPQEVEQLMQAHGANATTAMREMGQRVAMVLAKDCPLAVTLFSRMAGTEINGQSLNLTATPEEKPLLDKMARAICADLSAQEVKQPLAQMPKDKRMALVQEVMQKQIMAHAEELTKLYGADFFQDSARIQDMGAKVGALMASHCPTQVSSFVQP